MILSITFQGGEVFVNDDCTLKCLCKNSQLDCNESYTCADNAECDVTNDVRQCSCIEGHTGDGHTCEALYRDCKDVYDAGYTNDGVNTILPSDWPELPFTVYCKMDNGGGWTVGYFMCFFFLHYYQTCTLLC